MSFQIEKIILWSQDPEKEPRVINFELNKVNLITGSSKTGKSSIIPIIDYCLGSSKCSIPVNTIRDSTSWYGVQIKTDESRLLIARRDPGKQKSTSNAYMVESSSEINIPKVIPKHNSNTDNVKDRLNELCGVSNVSFDYDHSGRPEKARTSIRDLAAFNYQPQNIVANPNALFFKVDSAEHKAKLTTIFPYVLGAQNNEDLENIHRYKILDNQYKRIDRKFQKIKQQNQDWVASAQAYVIRAAELGIINIDNEIERYKPEQLLKILRSVSDKDIDYSTAASNIKYASQQEVALKIKSKKLSNKLGEVKARIRNLDLMREVTDKHSSVAYIKRNRLSLSKWLLDNRDTEQSLFSNPNEIKTLVLEPLARAFEAIEPELNVPERIQGVMSRENIYLENELSQITSDLNDTKEQLKILQGDKNKLGYDAFSVGRFVGEIESALKLMGTTKEESELAKERKKLKEDLDNIEKLVDPKEVANRTQLQLQSVNSFATKWLPNLDTENPDAPISLSAKELTIKVNNKGREDYLWEIGSGANWVSYHIAMSLALHQHFDTLTQSPVPKYIIYDQPSQVYFPSKLSNNAQNENEDIEAFNNDEDIKQVEKIFKVFNDVIDKTHHNLQVIVLDHAPSELVTKIKNGHLVEEWREGLKLVPTDWLQS